MKNNIVNRKGEQYPSDISSSMFFLYQTIVGRMILKILVCPTISKWVGNYLNSSHSKWIIPRFIKKNKIDMDEYVKQNYCCFNEFFCRKIDSTYRKIDSDGLISPCDSKLTYYSLDEDTCFYIKNSQYTVNDLLEDRVLADKYRGGDALVFRLGVEDYHRYCFIDDGYLKKQYSIQGILHTVNPIASYHYPIYKTNSREVSVLNTTRFGDVIYIEVGAMMVGKIKNLDMKEFKRGQTKGWFEFGGSTVVLLFEKGRIKIDKDIIDYSLQDIEVKVKMGERIGQII